VQSLFPVPPSLTRMSAYRTALWLYSLTLPSREKEKVRRERERETERYRETEREWEREKKGKYGNDSKITSKNSDAEMSVIIAL